MTRLVAYESQRVPPSLLRQFPPGRRVLAVMRKVPHAFTPALVEKVDNYGVHVVMPHPQRPSFLHQVFAPDDLVLVD